MYSGRISHIYNIDWNDCNLLANHTQANLVIKYYNNDMRVRPKYG